MTKTKKDLQNQIKELKVQVAKAQKAAQQAKLQEPRIAEETLKLV